MLGGTAARVYGFDLDRLAPEVARVGPTIEEVTAALVDPPTASLSSVFIPSVAEKKRVAYDARRG